MTKSGPTTFLLHSYLRKNLGADLESGGSTKNSKLYVESHWTSGSDKGGDFLRISSCPWVDLVWFGLGAIKLQS